MAYSPTETPDEAMEKNSKPFQPRTCRCRFRIALRKAQNTFHETRHDPDDTIAVRSLTDREESLARWKIFFSLTAVLLLCYAPVLVAPYAYADDYALLAARARGEMAPDLRLKVSQGRPTYALLLDLFFPRSFAYLGYLRLLGVVGIILLAWKLYRALGRAGWSRDHSFSMALIVCTLPPFQVYAACAVAGFFPFAALASASAFNLAERAFHERHPGRTWALVAGAVLLLLSALTIFQPAAMFFWVFAAIILFKPEVSPSSVLPRFLWYTATGFTGSILGFGVYKLGSARYSYMVPPLRSHLTRDIGEKALWFFREPLTNALNLVNLTPDRSLAVSVGVVITGGLILYLRGRAMDWLSKVVIALSLVPFSYLPNLLISESFAAYRTLSALTALTVVYAFFALWGYGRTLGLTVASPMTVGLRLAALISCFLAAHNVTAYFALPQSLEIKWLRGYLAQQDLSHRRSIYVISSSPKDSIAPAVRYDEFGLPSSFPAWSSGSMVYLLLREMDPDGGKLPIQVVPAGGPIDPPAGALVVDERRLSSLRVQ
jgi:hypothetical protein